MRREEERKAISVGYTRIKAKVKEIRQNYRKAVTEGQRSGSGKVVCDNWEELKVIWGGSPATVTIKNSVTSAQFDDSLFGAQGDNQFYSENDNDSGDDEHSLGSDNLPKENPQPISQQKTTNHFSDNLSTEKPQPTSQQKTSTNPTPKLISR